MPLNIYEQKLYDFITNKGIHIEKIPETGYKTPDFLIRSGEHELIAEVTEMKNDTIPEFGVAISRIVGKKLKTKLSDKKSQLEKGAKIYKCPAILIIYDTCTLPETEYHDIKSIFGDLTFSIDKESGKVTDMFHGKNAELRHDKNTALSAIIVGRHTSLEDISMIAYHNPYAKKPLPPNFFKDTFQIEEINFKLSSKPLRL